MSLIEEGKSILNLINKSANRELYEKLMEYMDKVFDLSASRASLQEEVQVAKRTVAEMEEKLAWKSRLVLREDAMVVQDATPSVPYCMTCWHKDRTAIPLKKTMSGGECGVCKGMVHLTYFQLDIPDSPRSSRRDRYSPFE